MKKIIALAAVVLLTFSGVSVFAKAKGSGKGYSSGKSSQAMGSYKGTSSQNGFKTGDRALDGSGKGFGDGTNPQPKDGTGFGAAQK